MGCARGCTVCVTGSRAVRWAGSGLGPPPAKLQAVGVGQGCAASEAKSLLLPRPALSHVHWQPRCPRRVAPHFGAALGVASLEFLGDGSRGWFIACSSQTCPEVSRARPPAGYRSRVLVLPAPPGPALALTTLQPGQELPFSQARRRDCTPPPQLLLHLLQEPQDAQKMGTGQGVFSLQNLRGMKEGVITLGSRHPLP